MTPVDHPQGYFKEKGVLLAALQIFGQIPSSLSLYLAERSWKGFSALGMEDNRTSGLRALADSILQNS